MMVRVIIVLLTTNDSCRAGASRRVVVPVVDVVLDDEKLVVVVVDAESLVVIATVGGAGSGVRNRLGQNRLICRRYRRILGRRRIRRFALAMTVGSSGGSARAGTISMESSIKEIATPKPAQPLRHDINRYDVVRSSWLNPVITDGVAVPPGCQSPWLGTYSGLMRVMQHLFST